jgi:hypothetical protein
VSARLRDLLVAGGVLLLGRTDRVVRPGEPSPGAELVAIALFGLTALLAVGFVVAYGLDGDTQVLGATLGLALVSLAAALIVIAKRLVSRRSSSRSTQSPSTRRSRSGSRRSSPRAGRGSRVAGS